MSKAFPHDSATEHSCAQAEPNAERKLVITTEALDRCLYGRNTVGLVVIGKAERNERKRKATGENGYHKKIKSIWCEECCRHIQGDCDIHGSKPRLTYAVKSFPAEVNLCSSSIPGYKYGACAGKAIPRGTWIGPYEGKPVYSKDVDQCQDNAYAWEIYKNGQFSHFLDGSDESTSSWMRFIRCARHKNEQNMGAFQYGENIYYKALQDIAIGEEILVWYDQSYAQFWGIPFGINHEISQTGSKGTPKDDPFAAQHATLPDAVNRPPMVPNKTTSPSTAPKYPQKPPQSVVPSLPTKQLPPLQTQPLVSPYATQQPGPITPPFTAPHQLKYQEARSFQLPPPPLQSPPSTVVPSPYQGAAPPPELAHYSMLSRPRPSGFQGTRGPPMQYVPRPPQEYKSIPHSTPNTNGRPHHRPIVCQAENVPAMNPATMTTLPTSSYWSATELKENMPMSRRRSSSAEYQLKTADSSQPSRSSPLQNLSSSVNTTSPPVPLAAASPTSVKSEAKDLHQVSSTVETKGEEQDTWKCGQCKKTFSQRLTLQMHVCSRAPEKPFQCGRCPLSFASPSQLRDHVITHSNDRPFKCGFCGRSFAGATTLNNHMRMHTGEKPFACEQCGATFSIGTQLSRHMKFGECQPTTTEKQWNHSTTAIAVE